MAFRILHDVLCEGKVAFYKVQVVTTTCKKRQALGVPQFPGLEYAEIHSYNGCTDARRPACECPFFVHSETLNFELMWRRTYKKNT